MIQVAPLLCTHSLLSHLPINFLGTLRLRLVLFFGLFTILLLITLPVPLSDRLRELVIRSLLLNVVKFDDAIVRELLLFDNTNSFLWDYLWLAWHLNLVNYLISLNLDSKSC